MSETPAKRVYRRLVGGSNGGVANRAGWLRVLSAGFLGEPLSEGMETQTGTSTWLKLTATSATKRPTGYVCGSAASRAGQRLVARGHCLRGTSSAFMIALSSPSTSHRSPRAVFRTI